MNKRDAYLNQLIDAKGKKQIKVITGVRRSGQSTLLELFADFLRETGVDDDAIIEINFELMEFDEIRDYKALYQYIEARRMPRKQTYIILDEVGKVSEWEKAVASLQADKNADVDIYITGSNASLLSSDLSGLLGGRYLEIHMLPLAFSEYEEFIEASGMTLSAADAYYEYLQHGGFPGIFDMNRNEKLILAFFEGIYHSILIKDVVSRNAIRDVDLLERVIRFVAGNIGQSISAKRISDYLTSMGRKTTHETVDNYLRALSESFIIYKARNYDIKGKQSLANLGKYFFVDIGMRNFLLGERSEALGGVLENQVFIELLFRGYQVYVGQMGEFEVDFVAIKDGLPSYYQVTTSMSSESVATRELRPLTLIKDQYPKFIVSTDKSPFTDYDGITQINIVDFLANR
jgi:predicted AAA+ superfamily ATPase